MQVVRNQGVVEYSREGLRKEGSRTCSSYSRVQDNCLQRQPVSHVRPPEKFSSSGEHPAAQNPPHFLLPFSLACLLWCMMPKQGCPGAGYWHYVAVSEALPHSWLLPGAPQFHRGSHSRQWHCSPTHRIIVTLKGWNLASRKFTEKLGCGWFGQNGSGWWRAADPEPHCAEWQ